MRRIVLLISCVLALGASTQIYGKGTVRGTVRDATDGETLPNANVLIDSLGIGVSADKSGYFVIGNLPPGRHVIRASFIGYTSRSVEIAIDSAETEKLVIELEPVELTFDEIEVVGDPRGANGGDAGERVRHARNRTGAYSNRGTARSDARHSIAPGGSGGE